MPKRTNKPAITVKQRKYIRGVMAGKSKYQAAVEAGYAENTANDPSRNVEKQGVKEELNRALEKAGITTQRIADKVNEGLEAKKTTFLGQGENSTFMESPDHAIQHKYLETAIKLKGIDREVGMPAALNFFNLTKADTEKYGV